MRTQTKVAIFAAFLGCCVSSQAMAQQAAAQESQSTEDDIKALRAELIRLSQRIQQLESSIAQNAQDAEIAQNAATQAGRIAQSASREAEAASLAVNTATQVTLKGAPEVKDDRGFTFKPRGRINIDAGYLSAPSSTGADQSINAIARRIRLGATGDVPGGFGYKIEVEFAGNEAVLTDAIVSYSDGGLTLQAGQFNPFWGLEEISSSLHTSFIERSAWTDVFTLGRRVGASAAYKTGDFMIQGGVFSDNSEDLPNDNNSFDSRVVYAPKSGSTQLHFGGSVHYNMLAQGSELRYRQRPLVRTTDDRFIDTGNFSATSELGIGLEAAAIAGQFHVSLEGYNQKVYRPGALGNPSFLGASAEVGYFLTKGDTRGYKLGEYDRVKPVNELGGGGIGAVQVNFRYDYLDLNSQGIVGGTQDSLQASLIWTPTDYTRLLLNYALLGYDDAALPTASGDTSYNVHVIGARAQIDF